MIHLLFFIFSVYGVQSQPVMDTIPLFAGSSRFELVDVAQQRTTKISTVNKELSLFIFLSPECPLSQNYTIVINQLQQKFDQQVNIFGIIPGNDYTVNDITVFENKYNTRFKILIDTKKQLTRYLQATVTPQAILLDKMGNLVYKGAIDDWVIALGKKRTQVSRHYVQDAIAQTLRSEFVSIKSTKAFGCIINDY
jgi:thiol-disulfide isomerase/thioredoxin